MLRSVRLITLLDPQKNSLTLVRLLAALSVIVSHAFEIAVAKGALQPFETTTPFNLGQHAVNAFFVISGLTLARALARDPDLARFAAARALRIFPALIVYGVIFALIAGPALTALQWPVYFAASDTLLYPLRVPLCFAEAQPPPGLFEHVPVPGIVNEPLWTIRYELAAYVSLVLLALVGWFPRPAQMAIAFALVFAGYISIEAYPAVAGAIAGVGSLARFALCFMVGVCAYVGRSYIAVSPVYLFAFVPVLWILRDTICERPAYILFVAYLVFVLGSLSFGALGRWTKRNDISYGTYLYGWPIQQSLMVAIPEMSIIANAAAALLLAPLAGYASWCLLEKQVLSAKSRKFASSAQ